MYYRTEGVILFRRNFGEADRILTFYTRDLGKLYALAKGVRRPKSRKGGHVEIGNWCKIFIAKGKNLDLLNEVETKKAYGISDFSPHKANKIFHLLELVDKLTAEKQKNIKVFSLLIEFLQKIVNAEDFKLLSIVFKIKLLSLLGFFSAKNLSNSANRNLYLFIEDEGWDEIKKKINLNNQGYLKVTSFLDSIIESITQSELNTTRFING